MSKKSLIGVIAALFSVFFLVGVLIAAEAPDTVTIQDPAYGDDLRKPPVPLNHAAHVNDYGIACTDCHHRYEDGENVWQEGDEIQTCGECHPFDSNEGNLYKMKGGTAFHKNCRDCHKEMEAGPERECDGCHVE